MVPKHDFAVPGNLSETHRCVHCGEHRYHENHYIFPMPPDEPDADSYKSILHTILAMAQSAKAGNEKTVLENICTVIEAELKPEAKP